MIVLRFQTKFGRMAVIWNKAGSRPRVHRILLPESALNPWPKPEARLQAGSCPAISALAGGIAGFLSGRAVRFDLSLLCLDLCRPFQRRVLLAEARIPRGKISTYGRIAAHLSHPSAPRAVGTALARNPFPVVIPCHRALRSDLSLGGYQGGLAMKRRLLEMEGIRFSPDGRAVKPSVHY